MTRRLLAVLLTLACALVFSACGSGSSPESSSNSDVPSGAEAKTQNGAMAFASHWVDTLNQATTSGDTTTLKRLAAKDCELCASFAESLDKIYGNGGHVESAGWNLQSEVPIAGQPKDNPGIQLNVQVAAQKVYPTKTAKPQSYQGGKQGLRMFLTRTDDHWVVEKLEPSA